MHAWWSVSGLVWITAHSLCKVHLSLRMSSASRRGLCCFIQAAAVITAPIPSALICKILAWNNHFPAHMFHTIILSWNHSLLQWNAKSFTERNTAPSKSSERQLQNISNFIMRPVRTQRTDTRRQTRRSRNTTQSQSKMRNNKPYCIVHFPYFSRFSVWFYAFSIFTSKTPCAKQSVKALKTQGK